MSPPSSTLWKSKFGWAQYIFGASADADFAVDAVEIDAVWAKIKDGIAKKSNKKFKDFKKLPPGKNVKQAEFSIHFRREKPKFPLSINVLKEDSLKSG